MTEGGEDLGLVSSEGTADGRGVGRDGGTGAAASVYGVSARRGITTEAFDPGGAPGIAIQGEATPLLVARLNGVGSAISEYAIVVGG